MEWLKKTKHSYPQNSFLQTQLLLVQLTAHSLMGSGTGLWWKVLKNTVHWHDPTSNLCPPWCPQPCQVQDSSPSPAPAAPLMTGLCHSQLDRSYGKSRFIGSTLWARGHNASGCIEWKLPEFTHPSCVLGTNTCLGVNLSHPAAPNTKLACPETHTASSHGESTQNCCKYSRCLHKGRAASPWTSKASDVHTGGTSELWHFWKEQWLGAPAARWAIPLVHAPCACSPGPSPANSPFPCHHFYIRNQPFPFLSPPPASIRCWLSTRCSKSIPQEQGPSPGNFPLPALWHKFQHPL